MARQGAIESLPKAPFILGFECSGVIEQVGEGVEKFKVSQICVRKRETYKLCIVITVIHDPRPCFVLRLVMFCIEYDFIISVYYIRCIELCYDSVGISFF